jgi:hypothetical protein
MKLPLAVFYVQNVLEISIQMTRLIAAMIQNLDLDEITSHNFPMPKEPLIIKM